MLFCTCEAPIRYCPCCGKLLRHSIGGEEAATATNVTTGNAQRPWHRPKSSAPQSLGSAAVTGADGSSPSNAEDPSSSDSWMSCLPPICNLSSFQVFCYVQNAAMGGKGVAEPIPVETQRRLAQQWLQATDEERRVCEERAGAWHRTFVNGGPSAGCSHVKDNCTAAFTTTTEAASVNTQASLAPTLNNTCSSSSHKKKKKNHRDAARRVTSFTLFRSANRGRFTTMKEASEAWQTLSVEEKLPFDEEAAQKRTELLLLDAQARTGASL